MMKLKNIRQHAVLCMLAINFSLQASEPPSQQPSAPAPSSPSSNPSAGLNTFLFTIAAGVVVQIAGKAIEYVANTVTGESAEAKQAQQERLEQNRMLIILETCKDKDADKELCLKLKQQYLEMQIARNQKVIERAQGL